MQPIEQWLKDHRVTEVECVIADINGIGRGKIVPAYKFIRSLEDDTLRLPESVFIQTVAGDYPGYHVIDPTDRDMILRPDPGACRLVPWYEEPTAQIIHDSFYHDGKPVSIASRQVLRHVVELYEKQGWKPVVAPELEFFLTKINADPDYPLEPPIGRSKRPESGRQSYGIEAANEFDPVFEDVYDWCETQEIDVDTLSHEAGRAQMEINFNHGDPIALADQVFFFKRTVKQAALKHDIYATFMAKPMEGEPGSSMHIHQSVMDLEGKTNLFAEKDGEKYSQLFLNFIGGLQRNLAAVMPLIAPNVNSYRRLRRYTAAPVNVQWGWENRTVGLRVPASKKTSRRIENRIAGADANPYLAIAATLACGYIGMIDQVDPNDEVTGDAYRLAQTLPQQMPDGLKKLQQSPRVKEVLGEEFVKVLLAVKQAEHEAYQNVISSWEREHLLLNV